MEFKVLKEEKGGYSKEATLRKVDAYLMLLMKVKDGKADRVSTLAELESIRNIEIKREKSGFFGSMGFSVKDTEEYMATLEEEINQYI